MMNILLIGAGGALGAISRHYVGQLALRTMGSGQPWGTLSVNILGGLLMGLLVGWLAATERAGATSIRLLAAVGFLGGFTTFSAFSLEMLRMLWEAFPPGRESHTPKRNCSTKFARSLWAMGLLLAGGQRQDISDSNNFHLLIRLYHKVIQGRWLG